MYRGKKIALVVPAYNEARLIGPTLESVPELFDKIYVVDDLSPDNQNEVILRCAARDPRICLIKHEKQQGPGGAIISGYRQAAADDNGVTVVVGGDNQMLLSEVRPFLDPIIDGKVDYTKGNRFLLSTINDTLDKMPTTRVVGNIVITALTKMASGYYKSKDVVDGYTAISKKAIKKINWDKAWKKYGYPMDFLIRLNGYGFKILEVPRTAVYLEGERQSQIKGLDYAIKVSPMLLKGFFWRLKFRYLYRDFHPLVFLYFFSFLALPTGFLYGIWLFIKQYTMGLDVTGPQAILCAMLILLGYQSHIFAMLFDMQESEQK